MNKKDIKRFIVFCFVGGTSALIHFLTFSLFYYLILNYFIKTDILLFGASIKDIISYIMGVIVSISYNFPMNRHITFSAGNEPVKKQLPKYIVVYALSIGTGFLVNLFIINLIGETGINSLIATACGILFSIPVSFLGSLLWTFKNKRL
jgi:putative flippase GtrA